MVSCDASKTLLSAVTYSACSSLMLVINKLALSELPFPTVLTLVQLVFCACCVLLLNAFKFASLDSLSWSTAKPFAWYCSVFAFGLYANMQVLERSSIGIVIAARSCLPVLVCAVDVLLFGATLPSARAILSLCAVGFFVLAYILCDHSLRLNSHVQIIWLVMWLTALVYQVTACTSCRAFVLPTDAPSCR